MSVKKFINEAARITASHRLEEAYFGPAEKIGPHLEEAYASLMAAEKALAATAEFYAGQDATKQAKIAGDIRDVVLKAASRLKNPIKAWNLGWSRRDDVSSLDPDEWT